MKFELRRLPETGLAGRPFGTAFKTVQVFGARYYAPVVTPHDLGVDAFLEDARKDFLQSLRLQTETD